MEHNYADFVLKETRDHELLVFLLYSYALNHQRESPFTDQLLERVIDVCSESVVEQMPVNKVSALAKSLRYYSLMFGKTGFEDYEKLVDSIYFRKQKE